MLNSAGLGYKRTDLLEMRKGIRERGEKGEEGKGIENDQDIL